jgi:hypothetical protein
MAGLKRLALTHHDPEHDDEFLERMEKLCRERFPNAVLAREGMEIAIGQAEAADCIGIDDRSSGDQVFGDLSGGGSFGALGSFCGCPAGAGSGMRTSNHV